SGVGAELLKSAIPISQAAKSAAKKSIEGKQALLAALTDGEDFELLFTVAARDAVKLADAWKGRFPALRLSCIGRIVAGKKIFIRDKGGTRALNLSGYSHFNDKCFS
ncbi:MAG: thiamine-monophosphate kinase, partial [Verrucomicrobia bacterium]|nr:thiamine-monophosphate kinase [Verrucomicrobiota bacterium]